MLRDFLRRTCVCLLALLFLFSPALAQEGDVLEYAKANCSANVRADASTRAEIEFILEPGERVNVYSMIPVQDQTWCFIRVSDAPQRKGYVLRELLDFEPSATPETALVSGAQATGNSREVDLSYYLAAVSQPAPALEDLFSEEELSSYRTLSTDIRGDDVLNLKNRLYELGYYAKAQTGPLYTDSTAKTVALFQQLNSLPEDGVASPLTQAVLFSEFALGADAQTNDDRPILIEDGRIVRYDSSSAVQIEIKNRSHESIVGFSLEIIPYSSYEEPVALGATLADAISHTWSSSGILLNHNGTFDCVSKKEYFVISPGHFFTGALVSVSAYTTADGVTVPIDAALRHWYAIGSADAADLSMPEKILLSQADRDRAASWSLGFSSIYIQPALQHLYGAPEGALVTSVDPFSFCAVSGLEAGDVVLAINSVRITGEDSLMQAKSLLNPGDSFELIYWREGSYFASTLTR